MPVSPAPACEDMALADISPVAAGPFPVQVAVRSLSPILTMTVVPTMIAAPWR